MNEVVKVKVEEVKTKTRTFRDGSGTPLIHTAEINSFFEGVFRRYHVYWRGKFFRKPQDI